MDIGPPSPLGVGSAYHRSKLFVYSTSNELARACRCSFDHSGGGE